MGKTEKMDNMEFQKQRFLSLLCKVSRDGINTLIVRLDAMGFFNAPCSGGFHLAENGGLVEHSNNVCLLALKIAEQVGYQNRDSVIIASLLHDVGKCGDYGKENYVENYLAKRDKEGNPIRSTTKPFTTNKNLLYIPHEVRSVAIIRQWFSLTEEEEHAIYYHNGKYTHTGYDLKETPLQMIVHFADLYNSRVTEKSDEEEKEF
jgi:putative nucleotidyltransferase with HDIG domain